MLGTRCLACIPDCPSGKQVSGSSGDGGPVKLDESSPPSNRPAEKAKVDAANQKLLEGKNWLPPAPGIYEVRVDRSGKKAIAPRRFKPAYRPEWISQTYWRDGGCNSVAND